MVTENPREIGQQLDMIEHLGSPDQFLPLPYSDFKRWTEEGTHFEEIYHAFPLMRLNGVKCLSFLSYTGPNNQEVISQGYPHTRLDHSLTVGLIAGEIARRNPFVLPAESVVKVEIAGLLHDIATPAYGDPTKLLDPEALHEEDNWQDILSEKGRKFLEKHGTNPEEVSQLIKNQGPLGQILDIADRITYVMKDLYYVAGIPTESLDINPYLLDMRYLLSHNPNVGDIYKTVVVEPKTEKVVFTNPEMLYVFLHLRALLWEGLYMHPNSQGRDLLVSNMIRPLYERGDLDGSKLRRMTDDDLEDMLHAEYSIYFSSRYNLGWDIRNWHPQWEKFHTNAEAKEAASKLASQGASILGIQERDGFDAGLNYNVAMDNEIGKFGSLHPQAYLVKNEVSQVRGSYLFYINPDARTRVDNLARAVFK